jgi:hypothetical protein
MSRVVVLPANKAMFKPPTIAVLIMLPLHGETWFSGAQEIEATAEMLSSTDITVNSSQFTWSGTEGPWEIETGLAWNHYEVDYSPVLVGTDVALDEDTLLGNIGVTHAWNPQWSGTARFRAYDGFADYRSIWISEYYRQFFGVFQDYRAPDPQGLAAGLSARWNYQTGSSAVFSFDFGRDEIAPGWSFDGATGQPEPGREILDTASGAIVVEHALNGWLKTEVNLSARQTSDRSARVGLRNSWAAASGPFALRVMAGYSEESPTFDALYGSILTEWNFRPEWSAHIGFRAYSDSGEIESSGFNASAPALDSTEFFTGLMWDRGDLAAGVGVGFLQASYAGLSPDNEFFGNLYQDRDWWTVRVSASWRF